MLIKRSPPLTHISMVLAGALLSAQAQADFNLTATGSYWEVRPAGSIQGKASQPELDVTDQLGLADARMNQLSLQLDHFVPLLPNLRITQTPLDFSGQSDQSIRFLDQDFTGNIRSSIDLSHRDVTAYYRLLDGVTSFLPLVSLRLELGLTARLFDGQFSITGDVNDQRHTATVDLNAPLPLAYLGGRVSLPLGISVGAQLNTLSYSGNQLNDLQADVRYEYDGLPLIKPGITAGYREVSITLNDLDGAYGDLTLDGPYLGAYVRVGF